MLDSPPNDKNEARLIYGPGAFEIAKNGEFVRCGVTGRSIPIVHLRYWCAEAQIPFIDAGTANAFMYGDKKGETLP